MINSPILMQSDSMIATDYSRSSQLWTAVGDLCSSYRALLPEDTFKEDSSRSQPVVSPCQRANNFNPQNWWVGGPQIEHCNLSWNSSATTLCPSSRSALALLWLSGTLESWSTDSPWGVVRDDAVTASLFLNSHNLYEWHRGCESRSCDNTALGVTSSGHHR